MSAGSSKRTWRTLAAASALLVVLGAGTTAYLVRLASRPHALPASSAPAPLTAAERALVAPLREGGTLRGFDVDEIQPVGEGGVLRIVCRKGRAIIRLDVALATDDGPPPAALAPPYAVYYAITNAAPDEGSALSEALAAVLRANAAPPPPGLRRFAPPARPDQTLLSRTSEDAVAR